MPARGQHQRRNKLAGLPQFGDHLESILAWKHYVEHHDVVVWFFPVEQFQGRFAGIDHLYLIALGFQVEAQAFGEVRLVFNHQNITHLALITLQSAIEARMCSHAPVPHSPPTPVPHGASLRRGRYTVPAPSLSRASRATRVRDGSA